MLECRPKFLCSWNFLVFGLAAGAASIDFDWLSEQGRIVIGPTCHEIRKHGPFSGHWTLEQSGRVVADALKPSALFRSFEMVAGDLRLTLGASSAIGRAFEIAMSGRVVGRIEPVHAFTRRAVIACSDEVPGHIQLFAFWLAAATWRRAANSSGAP